MGTQSPLILVSIYLKFFLLWQLFLACDFKQKIKDFNLGENIFAVVFTEKCIVQQSSNPQ